MLTAIGVCYCFLLKHDGQTAIARPGEPVTSGGTDAGITGSISDLEGGVGSARASTKRPPATYFQGVN